METMREYLKKKRQEYLKWLWKECEGDFKEMAEVSGVPLDELRVAFDRMRLEEIQKGGKHDGLKVR
jgi:hypothetical protein